MDLETSMIEKVAYSIEEISQMTSLSKAFLRKEIRTSNLRVKKFGRRVLVLRNDLEEYLHHSDQSDESYRLNEPGKENATK